MFWTLPNRLSLLRMILSPVFFFLFVSSFPVLRHVSIAVFLCAAITDWYDGVLARRHNTVTRIGKFLDPLADKFLTSAAFFAFAAVGIVAWWMVWAIIARDLLITMLRSLAEARDVPIVTSKTAQAKTFAQMAVLYYVLLLLVGRDVRWVRALMGVPALDALLDPSLIFALMLAVTILTIFTGLQYLYDNRKFLLAFFGSAGRFAD